MNAANNDLRLTVTLFRCLFSVYLCRRFAHVAEITLRLRDFAERRRGSLTVRHVDAILCGAVFLRADDITDGAAANC
jgi:hypothetical protein